MILDGKSLSIKLKNELKDKINKILLEHPTLPIPGLAIILVGDNPASEIYVRNKIKAAKYCGFNAELIKLNEDASMDELLDVIKELNNNPLIHGIIAQLPLPKHLDEQIVINAISPLKDVDGFGLENKGKMFSGLSSIAPATPLGIIKLLDEYQIEIKGKEAVVVGRSNIVGKPMAMLLLNRHATVTIAHSRTTNLNEVTKRADILVVAVGKPKMITKDMVKEGAVVIDVGINRIDGVLCGDVDFDDVFPKASYITPVPGGVGPLTIVTLLSNTIEAYLQIEKI